MDHISKIATTQKSEPVDQIDFALTDEYETTATFQNEFTVL